MAGDPRIDPVDARILDILQREGRRPYAEIGAEVGMSGPSAHERVKKLEGRGIVRGYSAQVDPAAVGLGVLAFMWVTQAPGSIADDITDAFAEIAEVEACHRIAGEGDYLLKIRARDTADLERVVRRVQATRHVYRTETDVVFSTPFERRPLPILADAGGAAKSGGRPAP
ncbi:MAG: Lrp/AsnC family transcriptional regulator [Chloroflexi bacterium]|nr:Lrp/AsnC family transcriptional regulator [Chloroflexota bacterium]